jgi:type IV pilus assembly protein PilB
MKLLSRDRLLSLISESVDIPPLRLTRYSIDSDVLKILPEKLSYSHNVLPLSRIGKQLTVAMSDPLNIFAVDDLKFATGLEVSPVLVGEEDMKEALRTYYERSADDEIKDIVSTMTAENMEMVETEQEGASSSDIMKITEEKPVVKMSNMILGKAVKERASDILIEPMDKNTRVRFRVDGVLQESFSPPKKLHQALISRLKVMSDLDIAERRLPQDGRFQLKVEGRKVDFRVSIVPSSYGEKAALRILDKEQARIDLDLLGFMESDVKIVKEASERPHGMIMVCGPTGCGKTTTLYSVLKHVDDPAKNIITVEDPVEYDLNGINQVSVNEELGLTFAACLRSILRQDPDIIMVGEIRDKDTLDVAVKSALTGHLVLSTLHTNTAAESITRMINMGIEQFLIASSVELIVAQRLLRKLCPECKKSYEPDQKTAETYRLFNEKSERIKIFKPRGCDYCAQSGYRGRMGIAECLRITPEIKELIFRNEQAGIIEAHARRQGMRTLRENGLENVRNGSASLEDVLRITVQPKDIDEKIGKE